MNELLIGIAGSGKTAACIERCRAAQADGRALLYLVPNRAEAAQVRRRLLDAGGGGAAFLPEVLGFSALAQRVIAAHRPGWSRSGPAQVRMQLLRLIAARSGRLDILERSSRSAGFLDELVSCFRELREGDVAPEDLREIAGASGSEPERRRLASLASLYGDYLADRSGAAAFDETATLSEAAGLLAAGGAGLLGGEPLLIVDGFSDLSPVQFRLFAALAARARGIHFTLCLAPADLDGAPRPPFESLQAMGRRLLALPNADWQRTRIVGGHRYRSPYLAAVAEELFRSQSPGAAPPQAGAVTLLEGATPRDEVDGIVRGLRLLISQGTPADRLAVLYRSPAYGPLLAERCADAGVPFTATVSTPLLQSAAAQLCLVLLDWAGGEAQPRDLLQRLRGGFVGTSEALLAEINTAARERGVPGAASSWDELFAEFRGAHAAESWDWLDWRAGMPARRLGGDEFLALVLKPLAGLLLDRLGARIAAAVATGREADALWDAEQDLPALARLLGVGGLLASEPPPWRDETAPLADWTALLRRLIESESLPRELGPEGGGVILGDPRDLRLPEMEAVFVCGLNQGSFPPAQRERTLLREGERQRLGELLAQRGGGRLQRRADELAESRYLFYISATRAEKRLCLSWAQRDGGGRSLSPSYYLEEIRALGGDLPAVAAVPALAISQKLRDPLDLRGLVRDTLLAEGAAAAPGPAAMARTWLEQRGMGHLLDTHGRPADDTTGLARHPALAPLLAGQSRFSASRLETYADCPYRFLMGKLLGLEDEPDLEPGAMEEGTFYHKLLELYFGDWDGRTAPGREAIAFRLESLTGAALADLAAELGGWVFASPRFRVENLRRLRTLALFLERDLERLAVTGFRPDPGSLEGSFEIPSQRLAGEELGEPFRIVGRVDRVDARESDGSRLVLDYKRSEKNTEPPGAESPRLFQLALYSLAIDEGASGAAYCALNRKRALRGYFRELLRDATARWSVGGGGQGRQGGHWLDDAGWRAWQESVAIRIREIVAAVRAGDFAALPIDEEKTCRTCDFGQLCRVATAARAAEGGDEA